MSLPARAQPLSPALPLAGLGALLLVAVTAVALTRWWPALPTSPAPASQAVESAASAFGAVVAARALRFYDRSDGGIDVVDAASAAHVDTVAPGSNGFVRGALRGLAQERKRRGLGDDVPFELRAHAGGALVLADPATGRRIELASFGPANAGAFARWLVPEEHRP